MSAALVINDLTVSEELDRKAMSAILGGAVGNFTIAIRSLKVIRKSVAKSTKCTSALRSTLSTKLSATTSSSLCAVAITSTNTLYPCKV